MGPNVVSGVISTVADIGRDEAWLRDWLREQPARMGLGDLRGIDPEGDDLLEEGQVTGLLAVDDERVYSIDVRLGELEAAAAFGVLQGWAASLGHDPEKEHVAVLVTERLAERFRGTLTALAERLPLLVVGLSVWRGDTEAIVVPHVALASATLDLSNAPAVAASASLAAASSVAASSAASLTAHQPETDPTLEADPVDDGSETAADSETAEAEALAEGGIDPGIAPDDEIDLDDEVDGDDEIVTGDDDSIRWRAWAAGTTPASWTPGGSAFTTARAAPRAASSAPLAAAEPGRAQASERTMSTPMRPKAAACRRSGSQSAAVSPSQSGPTR